MPIVRAIIKFRCGKKLCGKCNYLSDNATLEYLVGTCLAFPQADDLEQDSADRWLRSEYCLIDAPLPEKE